MARREQAPRDHRIEAAGSDDARCHSCHGAIASGELWLAEAYVRDDGAWARQHRYARTPRARDPIDTDDGGRSPTESTNPDVAARFHHLACAARHHPYKLRSALAATSLEIEERDELERAIEAALSPRARDSDPHATENAAFVADLADRSDDDALLVYADWLQRIGDPRGELAVVQAALETARGEDRVELLAVERRLFAAHRELAPARIGGTATWRRGFIDRLVVHADAAAVGALLEHAALRLVRELAAPSTWVLPPRLPAPLRVLELGQPTVAATADPDLGHVQPYVAALPRLGRLVLHGATELGALAHPALTELELGSVSATRPSTERTRPLAARLAELALDQLPALSRLVLRVERGLDDAILGLVRAPRIHTVASLALHGELSLRGAAGLAEAGRWRAIDLRGCKVSAATLDAVRAAADTVQIDHEPVRVQVVARPGERLVRHTRRPEWGVGRVTGELEQGVTVAFEHAGEKQIRNLDVLEDLEAEPS